MPGVSVSFISNYRDLTEKPTKTSTFRLGDKRSIKFPEMFVFSELLSAIDFTLISTLRGLDVSESSKK